MVELSIPAQECVIVQLASLGATVLVRCSTLLHYLNTQDLGIQPGFKFPIVS